MAKAKQLTIAVEDRPGALAEIARTLGDAKVNILGVLGVAQGGSGTIHLVVGDARRAHEALRKAGISASESTVEQIELPNRPGALAKYLERLAAKNVNLSAIYASASKGGRKATVVLAAAANRGA